MFFLRFHKQTFRVGPTDKVSTCFCEKERGHLWFCHASAYHRIVTHHVVSISTFLGSNYYYFKNIFYFYTDTCLMYWKVVTPDLLGSHKTIAMRESTKGSD